MKQGMIARLAAIAIAISGMAYADRAPVKTEVTRELVVDRYALPEFQDLARFRQEQRQRMAALSKERAEYLPGLNYRQQKVEKKVESVTVRNKKTFKAVLKYTDTPKKDLGLGKSDNLFYNPFLPVVEEKQVQKVKTKKVTDTSAVKVVRSVKRTRESYEPRGKIKVMVTKKSN